MSSPSVSGSPSSNSWINELVLRALQEEDDAEMGSSLELEDDQTVVFEQPAAQGVPQTPSPIQVKKQDSILWGVFTLEEIESPRFPPTPISYEACTPIQRRSQVTELTFRNELHKIYVELTKYMARSDLDLLLYPPSERRILINLIELLRTNMRVENTRLYEEYFQVVQKRFANPIFKGYFPAD
ncbi:MAG TPA: hypothetical protein VIJ14_00165 [Rhabdochlamydiaceae bacterium]